MFLRLCLVLALVPVAVAQTNLHTVVADGAWTWFNDPRALFHHGRLYVASVRNGDGRGTLTAYDPTTGAAPILWTSSWSERDDHDGAALLPLQDGRLMAFYARHSVAPFFAFRTSSSTNPSTAADWGGEQVVNVSATVTFANPYQLSAEGGRIYHFFRSQNFNPTFTVSDDFGTNWAAPRILIQTGSGSTRPGINFSSDETRRIDFLYTDGHPREVTNSLYHAYYKGGGIYRSDGTFLKHFTNAPLLHDLGERGSVIYAYASAETVGYDAHIPFGRAWCWEIVPAANEGPVCAFSVQRDDVAGLNWFDARIYYYYARWTGTNWQKRFIAHAGRPLYSQEEDYAGGICLDPEAPHVVYISSNAADPFNLGNITNVPLRPNERYEIYRGVTSDGGLTFQWTGMTSNSAVDNLRPYVPRKRAGVPALMWFRGVYNAYDSYDCSVVALLTNAVPLLPTVTISSPTAAVVHLTNNVNQIKLVASVSGPSEGVPATMAWSTVSGPMPANFSEPTNLTTFANFSQPGVYLLRATVNRAGLSNHVTVTILVGNVSTDEPDVSRVLWLKLDENSGFMGADSSGYLNQASLTGGTAWLPTGGQRGGALAFNGVNATASVADAASLDNTSVFTLAFWFRANAWPPNSAALVSKREGPITANAYTTYLDSSIKRIFVDVDHRTASNDRFSSGTTLNTGVWYHVAVVFNGALPPAQRVNLWINGTLDVVANETSASVPDYASQFRLGNMPSTSATWFNGAIDDVRFYRRALPANEVVALSLSNTAPNVLAGIVLSATNALPSLLNGAVADDGRGGPLSICWGQGSGPGLARFGNSNSPITTVTFNQRGEYRLRLCASDSTVIVCDDLTVSVEANPNLYQDWIVLAFPNETDPAVIGPTADPDFDGELNLAEFGFVLNPGQPDLSPLSIRYDPDQGVRLTYRRRIEASHVQYRVLASADFQDWQSAEPFLVHELTERHESEHYERATFRVSAGPPGYNFFNVSVEAVEP